MTTTVLPTQGGAVELRSDNDYLAAHTPWLRHGRLGDRKCGRECREPAMASRHNPLSPESSVKLPIAGHLTSATLRSSLKSHQGGSVTPLLVRERARGLRLTLQLAIRTQFGEFAEKLKQ